MKTQDRVRTAGPVEPMMSTDRGVSFNLRVERPRGKVKGFNVIEVAGEFLH